MEFCPKCGSILLVEKKRKKTFLICRKCGWKHVVKKRETVKITTNVTEQTKEVAVIDKKEQESQLPKTRVTCPNCGNEEAYWWMQQTRGADEPPTIFYKCTKCGYSWRSYG